MFAAGVGNFGQLLMVSGPYVHVDGWAQASARSSKGSLTVLVDTKINRRQDAFLFDVCICVSMFKQQLCVHDGVLCVPAAHQGDA